MTAPRPARRGAGIWYLFLAVLSAGFLACVPFWHAASRLQRPDVRRWAVAYTLVTVWLVVLGVLTPEQNPDGTFDDSPVSALGGFSALIAMVVAAVRLNGLRREVYAVPAPQPVRPVPVDPAIAGVLAARQRRAEAREVLARDRPMARELGIGRPDLGRGFDDGGLVDINTAPAAVIAQRCDLSTQQAAAVVAARDARGGPGWFAVDEVLVDVPLPEDAGERIRDRAFV